MIYQVGYIIFNPFPTSTLNICPIRCYSTALQWQPSTLTSSWVFIKAWYYQIRIFPGQIHYRRWDLNNRRGSRMGTKGHGWVSGLQGCSYKYVTMYMNRINLLSTITRLSRYYSENFLFELISWSKQVRNYLWVNRLDLFWIITSLLHSVFIRFSKVF